MIFFNSYYNLNISRNSNRQLKAVLEKWGMPEDFKGLESFYIQQLQTILGQKSIKKQSIGKNYAIITVLIINMW
jgi:hypothetical protein